jgi:hypothetical protein
MIGETFHPGFIGPKFGTVSLLILAGSVSPGSDCDQPYSLYLNHCNVYHVIHYYDLIIPLRQVVYALQPRDRQSKRSGEAVYGFSSYSSHIGPRLSSRHCESTGHHPRSRLGRQDIWSITSR